MCRLVETIRAENGRLLNIAFHDERMKRSAFELFGLTIKTDLGNFIDVPGNAGKGVFKCRVEYDDMIRKVEFIPYKIKIVNSLKLIEDNKIDYRYKYVERGAIEDLMAGRGECDDILIIKNGCVTDSSYANVIFMERSGKWVTPATFLLPGTRRAALLQMGLITEKNITSSDIFKFVRVRLINAMVGIDDSEGISVDKIFL